MVLRAPAHPMPVSPRPWRKIMVAVWRAEAFKMTGGTREAMSANKKTRKKFPKAF